MELEDQTFVFFWGTLGKPGGCFDVVFGRR